MTLRDYQSKLKNDVLASFSAGSRATLAQLPTGGGKTVIMADITATCDVPTCMIAHRQELVGQISMAAARAGIYHRIIAPPGVVKWIITQHIEELGRSYYQPRAWHAVTGVDTIIRRTRELHDWMQQVRLWQIDEGHHLRADNKWGRAAAAFPNARGIAWTGTPLRPDGKSLKRGAGGVYDMLVCGPSMRTLINAGHLTDYRIFGPEETIDLTGVDVTASGDFSNEKLRDAVHKAKRLVGDTVQNYLRLAPGKLGLTFCVDVEAATETAAAYRAAGVPAIVITANTPAPERAKLMAAFKRREFLQLVNVDICGEGTDIPAVEVISLDRPTRSFVVHMQQIGRVLRPAPGKTHGIIIDHAGNVRAMAKTHGLPDDEYAWSLDTPIKRRKLTDDGDVRLKTCLACRALFEAHLRVCPVCGERVVIVPKSKPEQCEGDLLEYTPELLDSLRGQASKLVRELPRPVNGGAQEWSVFNNWNARRDAQHALRDAISLYGGWCGYRGVQFSQGYREFFRTFGVDVLSAQLLSGPRALELTSKIYEVLR
jgi:superfamily II DNA or RNA helicase